MDGIGSTIALILVLVLVMFAAYFTTKFLSNKARHITRCKYIEQKDRMFLGRDKSIVLLQVGEEVFLVGITNQAVNLIGTLKKEDLKPAEQQETTAFSGIKGIFKKAGGFIKYAGNAQEELKKAQAKARQQKRAQESETYDDDEIERILSAIKERKSKLTDKEKKGGGNEEI